MFHAPTASEENEEYKGCDGEDDDAANDAAYNGAFVAVGLWLSA